MNDLTTSYFSIEKSDKQPDGTLMVYGKATDDSIDIDQQICDAAWLDRAMPAWFKSGGNIREQHSSIAAGVAKEYEVKADGHYIMAHVVDPVSVRKVDAGVLRGFSIGIKSPRVVRDQKAANGRIIDGQIVEVSLVDRPANPNCQLVLAKSVDGESSLIQVEELTEIEKHGSHNQSAHGRRGAGGGAGGGGVSSESKEKIKQLDERAKRVQYELRDNNPSDDPVRDRAYNKVNAARENIERAQATDDPKEAVSELKQARQKLEPVKNSLEEQNYHSEAETINEMQKDMNSLAVFIGRTNKSSDADVEKHGSHNQSAHGRRGSGGGAGGGATNPGAGSRLRHLQQRARAEGDDLPNGTPKKVAQEAVDSAENEMNDTYRQMVKDQGQSVSMDRERVLNAAQMRDDAFGHLDDARTNITRGRSEQAASALDNAAGTLKDEPQFTIARQKMKDTAAALRSKPVKKHTDAELRKALQSALQSLTLNKSEENPMQDTVVELPTEAVGDLLKFDKTQYEAAREALANLIAVEAGEMREGHNELQSIAHLLEAVAHLHAWYEGEEAEGEVMEEETIIERAADAEMEKEVCKMCKKSEKMCKCEGGYKAATDDEVDAEKGAEPNPVPSQETYATLQGTVIVPPTETPKSAEAEEPVVEEAPAEEPAVEETPAKAPVEEAVTEDSEAKTEVDAADVEAIVEQVVKSATESLRAEIASLVAAKEAALEKSVGLESELAIAKSLAVAGGPSRTVKPLSTKINDNLTKAAIYKAKANATTDPVLAKGYKQLAEEFYSKATDSDN